MAATNIRGTQVVDGSIQRPDLDVTTVGKAVVAKLIQGSGITLSSTGADAGTGDVTINGGNVLNRGTWSSATAYAVNDVVQRNGISFICTTANTNQDPAAGSNFNVGNTTQGGTSGGFGNGLTAVQITTSQAANLQSLSIFFSSGSNIVLGLYSDSSNTPNALLATTGQVTSVNGLNTLATTTNPVIAAGKYWIAVMNQVNGTIGYYNSGGLGAWNQIAYSSTLPNPFTAGYTTGALNFSLYATFSGGSSYWSLLAGTHAVTHESAGLDPIPLDTLAPPTDIVNLNVSTNAHGLCPKAPNDIKKVLRGDGAFGTLGVSTDSGNLAVLGSDNLISVPTSAITSVSLRAWNAVSNPGFEIDQRNCFTGVANIGNGGWSQDRWQVGTAGTMKANTQAFQGQTNAIVPGTSFLVSQGQLNTQVATVEASLAAGDYWFLTQFIEGPMWRELSQDVSSISILCSCSIASFSFAVSLRDQAGAHSLVKLGTTSATPGALTLITLPNIPKPTAGTFSTAPGVVGYQIGICLACGSTLTAPALNTWQTGNFIGASGMSNLFATSGANFILYFVQHQPGSQCTTLIDQPWTQAYDGALRYFCKSYDYGTKAGTAVLNGMLAFTSIVGFGSVFGSVRHPKPLAVHPTLTFYNPGSGALNSIQSAVGNNYSTTTVADNGTDGFCNINISPNIAIANDTILRGHYTADTGW